MWVSFKVNVHFEVNFSLCIVMTLVPAAEMRKQLQTIAFTESCRYRCQRRNQWSVLDFQLASYIVLIAPLSPLIWPLLAGGLPACLQLTRRFHVAAADGCRLPVAGCWLHWRWRWWCSWCSCCCVAFPFTICRMRWPFCRVRSRVVCSRVWPQMMMTATLAACWEHLPLTSSSFSSSRFSHLI